MFQFGIYSKPFKLHVWLSVAGSVPFIALVIWLMSYHDPIFRISQLSIHSLIEGFFSAFGALFTQGMCLHFHPIESIRTLYNYADLDKHHGILILGLYRCMGVWDTFVLQFYFVQ